MKTVYVCAFLLVAANILSLSPMEIVRKKSGEIQRRKSSGKQSLFPAHPYGQIEELHNPFFQQPSLPTNQPHYEKLDEPTNVVLTNYPKQTSPRNQISPTISTVLLSAPIISTTSDHLTTIYKQTTKSAEREEKKSLLYINSLCPNPEHMQRLYKGVRSFIIDKITNAKPAQNQIKELSFFIKYMENNDLDPHAMGKFAYNNKEKYTINNEDISSIPAFLFILLNNYAVTIRETKEGLPCNPYAQKPSLQEALNSTSHTITSDSANTCVNPIKYPAFANLILTLQYALQELSYESINKFATYVYADGKILLKNYSNGSYENLKNEIHDKIRHLLLWECSMDGIHDLMQTIDRAKNVKDIIRDAHFESDILEFEPNEWGIIKIGKKLLSVTDPAHSPENIKNRMTLLFRLITKYNNTRGTKKTPTAAQWEVHSVIEALNFPLSNSDNNHLLDKNKYAFAESKQLFDYTLHLINIDANTIKEYTNKLNSQKALLNIIEDYL